MRRIRDFRCPDNHTFEALVYDDVTELPCRKCSLSGQRIISPTRTKLDPISGDFPGATMKWARNREQQIKLERKRENS